MLALSVKQPWAQLIICGLKPIEIRAWIPPKKAIGQRVYIHAGKQYDYNAPENVHELFENILLEDQQYILGCLIGTAVLTGYKSYEFRSEFEEHHTLHWNPPSWYGIGLVGFIFSDPQPLKEPIPYRGQLGFFEVKI